MTFTIVLWVVGVGASLWCSILILAGIFSRGLRQSGFGGGAWMNAIILLPVALAIVWWASSRSP